MLNLSTWISQVFQFVIVPRGIAETVTRAPPQLHKTPPTREKAAAAQLPCRPLREGFFFFFFTGRGKRLNRGGARPRPRGGRYHKSPNDATLQLCTPKRELEPFFHPPLLAVVLP